LKKIIAGERIQLFTTRTIHESYKRKINAITNLNMEQFYDFVPVPIGMKISRIHESHFVLGEPFSICGAVFEFDYSFHTIPTLRFKTNFSGRSISYSADTLYDSAVRFIPNRIHSF
jgi:hypothetical protein